MVGLPSIEMGVWRALSDVGWCSLMGGLCFGR
jgi:hypothetical protein